MSERNVLGEELQPCGTDPLTGFYRDGCCTTDSDDPGNHSVCTVVTAEFLTQQQAEGNDLVSPRPEFGFPGLSPGDRWCVCAPRWLQADDSGTAPPVILAATHERAAEVIPLELLQRHSVDVPADPSGLA